MPRVLVAGLVAILIVVAVAWRRARRPSSGPATEISRPTPPPGIAPVTASPAGPAARVDRAAARPARPSPTAVSQPVSASSQETTAALRIDALVREGEIGRARDAAEDFLRLYPYSGYCQHIETLTGVHPRPPIPGE